MRHILLSASFILMTMTAYGQTAETPQRPCTLKPAQAPAVRGGVKLDMTLDELFAVFPGLSETVGSLSESERYPNFGLRDFSFNPSNYSRNDRFAGIGQLIIRSFDRRVVGLDVYYPSFPSGARWRNPDDLVQRFSESLHLPGPGAWATSDGYVQRKLNCDGFEITVSTANEAAEISFNNRGWVQTQKERFAAFEEQKRREFKP